MLETLCQLTLSTHKMHQEGERWFNAQADEHVRRGVVHDRSGAHTAGAVLRVSWAVPGLLGSTGCGRDSPGA